MKIHLKLKARLQWQHVTAIPRAAEGKAGRLLISAQPRQHPHRCMQSVKEAYSSVDTKVCPINTPVNEYYS